MVKNSGIPTIPLSKLVPSILTLMALCLGITSIRYALDSKWVIAASLIMFAAILDGIDGRVAKMLDATSKFGAELDSLSDMVSFGVAPALVTYLWSLSSIPYKGVGWAIVLFYVACSAIRLARFNAGIDGGGGGDAAILGTKQLDKFFTGVPMPAAGLLLLLPMILTFEMIDEVFSCWFTVPYMVTLGLLMVSRIPTFSAKSVKIPKEYVSLVLVLAALIMSGLILEPWYVVPVMAVVYVLSIPFAIWNCRKTKSM